MTSFLLSKFTNDSTFVWNLTPVQVNHFSVTFNALSFVERPSFSSCCNGGIGIRALTFNFIRYGNRKRKSVIDSHLFEGFSVRDAIIIAKSILNLVFFDDIFQRTYCLEYILLVNDFQIYLTENFFNLYIYIIIWRLWHNYEYQKLAYGTISESLKSTLLSECLLNMDVYIDRQWICVQLRFIYRLGHREGWGCTCLQACSVTLFITLTFQRSLIHSWGQCIFFWSSKPRDPIPNGVSLLICVWNSLL